MASENNVMTMTMISTSYIQSHLSHIHTIHLYHISIIVIKVLVKTTLPKN